VSGAYTVSVVLRSSNAQQLTRCSSLVQLVLHCSGILSEELAGLVPAVVQFMHGLKWALRNGAG
jgi:hypothetical protein